MAFYHVISRGNGKGIFAVRSREEGVYQTVYEWEYKLREVGDYLGLHYSLISRILAREAKSKT